MILKGEGKNLPAFKYFIHAVFRATAHRQVQNRQKSVHKATQCGTGGKKLKERQERSFLN